MASKTLPLLAVMGSAFLLAGCSADAAIGQRHPGLIARIYMGQPSTSPTPFVGIIASSADYHAWLQKIAESSMVGIYDSADAQYVAHGFISLDRDTDVSFDLQNCHCEIDGELFWRRGSITRELFTRRLTRGHHTIRLLRADHGQNGPEFSIQPIGSDRNVLYHTDIQLKSELSRQFALDGKTYDSVLLSANTNR